MAKIEPAKASVNVPVLTIPAAPKSEGIRLTVGIPDILFDGQPFPWATVGEWSLAFADEDFATLTISIPVAIGANADG